MQIRRRAVALFLLLLLTACKGQSPGSNLPAKSEQDESAQKTGPAHWAEGPSVGRLDLLGVDLVDDLNGWAVGDMDPGGRGGLVYFTSDGGRTWRPIANVAEILSSVQFINPNLGWVAGYAGRIERTDDGGRTWKTQRVEREGEVVNSIFFIDQERGWAAGGVVGIGGLVYRTENGGADWVPITIGRPENLWCVRFVNRDRGWAVGDEGLILTTSNGGRTWSPQRSGTRQGLVSLALTSDGGLIAVGSSGTVLRSAEGSAWAPVASGVTESLNSVAAAGSLLWAVGSRGVLITSTDAGRTWRSSTPVGSRDLLAVDVVSSRKAIAVGRRGYSQVFE